MNRTASDSRPDFTPKQGQYLAFIHAYTLVNGRPPAEADMIRFFKVTPPTVHQMVLTLEHSGLISRRPGAARTIKILVDQTALPALQPIQSRPVKITVSKY
jgi:DNA-binding MarR family transcriptional regulator